MKNFMLVADLVPKLDPTDYVGFTFFVGCMAMMAASAFFFLSLNQFDKKWRHKTNRTIWVCNGMLIYSEGVGAFLLQAPDRR